MPWVEFTSDYMWRPTTRLTIAYKKGMVLFVTRACAAKSIEKGKAVLANRPQTSGDASKSPISANLTLSTSRVRRPKNASG